MSSNYDSALALARVRSSLASGRAQQVRETARLSQQEVGAAIGASRLAVSSWESKRRLPRGVLAERYCALLDALEHANMTVPFLMARKDGTWRVRAPFLASPWPQAVTD